MIQTDEEDLLINGGTSKVEEPKSFSEKVKGLFAKDSGFLLFIYVILCILFGAANRVSFKVPILFL